MSCKLSTALPGTNEELVELILQEGDESLLDAFRSALPRGTVPNRYHLMREIRLGRLEAIKVLGQWRTSAARVRAYLARKQPQRTTEAGS